MTFEAGRAYRAKTAAGEIIHFTVRDDGDGVWVEADLFSHEGPEPRVWLNTQLLLWVSTEESREHALTHAAEEVIEALERSSK